MDKVPIEMQSHSEPPRTLHVVGKSSGYEPVRIDHSGVRGKIWLALVVVALLGVCIIGVVVGNKRTNAKQRPSPEQERIAARVKQLSSLTQTDLIVFPDGRVWYVRAVHGKNMEVVGWIGNNIRSENIESFVLKGDDFTIVRRHDPGWPMQRDKFLEQ